MNQHRPYARDPAARMGRWMVIGAWLALLALLTYLFSAWLDHQHNPNRNLQLSSVDGAPLQLQRNRYGHYVASGSINGVSATFLLDTGATHVALSEEMASQAGLRKGRVSSSMTANGMVRSWLTQIEEVRLGPIVQRNVRASILPSMRGEEVLLGMSFLKHLELLQKGDKLIIRVPTE